MSNGFVFFPSPLFNLFLEKRAIGTSPALKQVMLDFLALPDHAAAIARYTRNPNAAVTPVTPENYDLSYADILKPLRALSLSTNVSEEDLLATALFCHLNPTVPAPQTRHAGRVFTAAMRHQSARLRL